LFYSSIMRQHQQNSTLATLVLCWTATTVVLLQAGVLAFLPSSQFSVQQQYAQSINSLHERQQPHLTKRSMPVQGFSTSPSSSFTWNVDSYRRRNNSGRGVDLAMAFQNSEQDDSNIFDGPMALTKERDACGVGFIANTQSGGTSFFFSSIACRMCCLIQLLDRSQQGV
jgi:hypothetical protein